MDASAVLRNLACSIIQVPCTIYKIVDKYDLVSPKKMEPDSLPHSHSHLHLVPVSLCFLLILLLSFFRFKESSKGKQAIHHWPMVGALPSLLANAHRFPEWVTEVFMSLGHGVGSFSIDGPVFSNLHLLFTCNPQNIEYILKTNFSNFPKGPAFMEINDILGNGIFIVDGDSWSIQRRMMHTLLKSGDFRSGVSTSIRNKVEYELVPFFSNIARQASVIDLQDICSRLAYDCAVNTFCGGQEQSLSLDVPHSEMSKALTIAQEAVLYRHIMPMFCWKFLRFLNVWKERDLAKAERTIECFISEYISGTKMSDFRKTELFSILNDSSKNHKFSRDMLANLFVGSRDSLSSALVSFFWMVAKTPHVEKKIVDELKSVALKKIRPEDDGGIRSKRPCFFDFDELKDLVYLQAALYESLRLWPSLPFNSKCVLQETVLPDGSVVKPGMHILMSFFSEGRMPWIWGEDSLEFRPERWIDDEGNIDRQLLSKFFVFNIGPRSCLGKDITFIQMKVCVAAVLFNFHIELLEGQDICSMTSINLLMRYGLLVHIRDRVMW